MKNVKLTPSDVANITGGMLVGPDSTPIDNITGIQNSKEGCLTFLSREDYEKYMDTCNASCIIVPRSYVGVPQADQSYVMCDNPYLAIVAVLNEVVKNNQPQRKVGIHRSAIIAPSARVAKTASIGARCIVGENCILAENVELRPNVILYNNVIIGEGSVLHANVVCYDDTIIGKRCIVHSGAVIGADGFGFVENSDSSYEKIPQLGNVIVGDHVEIGANTTIDRALMDSTLIGNGVKIDNLCHIAHNCTVGDNSAMAAQVGISGSTNIGKRNRIGGQVGIAGHLDITNDVVLSAQSGVAKSIKDKGIYFGSPAKERLQAFKIEAYLRRLPDIAVDVEMLKKHLLKNATDETED
jgi:UDP-3-O-[3-hydroxymyristoyl] glucosamine N-acyltransferase